MDFTGFSIQDLNGRNATGFMIAQTTSQNGIRMSSGRVFIRSAIKNERKNLHVMLNTIVTKVRIEIKNNKKIVTGVEAVRFINGTKRKIIIRARKEVIVSGGAINSPQILLLSGIGPEKELKNVSLYKNTVCYCFGVKFLIAFSKVGIPIVHNLPGVGLNLHNHVAFTVKFLINETNTNTLDWSAAFEYLAKRSGPMSHTGLSQVTGKISSKYAESDTGPDLQFYFSGYTADCTEKGEIGESSSGGKRSIGITPAAMHPKSRGYLTLNSSDPLKPPKIVANYLHDDHDVKVLIEGVKFAIRLSETKALKAYGMELDKTPIPSCKGITPSDKYWECAIRQNTAPENHQAGSCKMGPKNDTSAVVDNKLRVHGIIGLRVVDSSIMPKVVSGNTNAPIIAIAEKAADLIRSTHNF